MKNLKNQGYTVENLPDSVEEFTQVLHKQANTYRASSKGEIEKFFKEGSPALVESQELDLWLKGALPEKLYKEVVAHNGASPGIT